MPENAQDPQLKAIESALGELVPVASRLDRDKLMFQAGAMTSRESRRRAWVRPGLIAVLGLALCAESVILASRPGPEIIERYVFVPALISAPSGSSIGGSDGVTANASAGRGSDEQMGARGRESRPDESWPVGTEYERMQAMVVRFGLDAIQRPESVAAHSDGGEPSTGTDTAPAGALRSIELRKILNPGDPS